MSNASFLFTERNIILNYDGKNYILDVENKAAKRIRDLIKVKAYAEAADAINIANSIKTWTQGKVSVVGNELLYDGEVLHGTLSKRVLDMYAEGFDITPMVRFIENLKLNPSFTAVEELYLFLEAGSMPITDDGCFLAYKKVGVDYKDCYTGTIDNSVGATPSMKRNEVDDDRNRTCSRGLHFCALEYLSCYYGSSGHIMIVKINPADVVAIPSDYNNTKGRCWTYEVVKEYECTNKEKAEYFNQAVYSADNDWEGSSEEGGLSDAEVLDNWWEWSEDLTDQVLCDEAYEEGYKQGFEEGTENI